MGTWGAIKPFINIVHQGAALGLALYSPIKTKAIKSTSASHGGEGKDQAAPSPFAQRDDFVREAPTVVKRFGGSGRYR